jgi:predicted Rossmann fold nucleotide-binding protein DprA/Smf involved in DNA uptake
MVDACIDSLAQGFYSTDSMQNQLAAWIALTRVKGLGCASFKKLALRFADPTQALSASSAARSYSARWHNSLGKSPRQ